MPKHIDNVLSWASDVEDATIEQAAKASRLPFVRGHLALMPDAHVGIGATVGSVIPTEGAIIPAAVGVDIGCGMIAADVGLTAERLPDDLGPLLSAIEESIPAGVGKGRDKDIPGSGRVFMPRALTEAVAFKYMGDRHRAIAANQLGTLGSGNHFVEVCLDERGLVWVVLHSGSRGVGNKLAQHHIQIARGLMKDYFIELEDPDLAYLVQGKPEFDAYIADMNWAQDYALENREAMMRFALSALADACEMTDEEREGPVDTVNCHHNFTRREHQVGRNMWITRKGAIGARAGQRGVIPGSMGTSSYIVHGLGNPTSYYSCSHGAGRRMSRSRARKELTVDSLREQMGDRTWNADKAEALLDEHPDSYKSIDQVMADQADLVAIDHTLHQVLNYKGA